MIGIFKSRQKTTQDPLKRADDNEICLDDDGEYDDWPSSSCDEQDQEKDQEKDQEEQVIDKQWLQQVYAKRAAALQTIIAKEIADLQAKFLALAKTGRLCECEHLPCYFAQTKPKSFPYLCKFNLDTLHEETIAHLIKCGVFFSEREKGQYYASVAAQRTMVCLAPLSSSSTSSSSSNVSTQQWRVWVELINSTYGVAHKRLVLKQFENIKAAFDSKASKGVLLLRVTVNACFAETADMLRTRLGCEITMTLSGDYKLKL
jgi:hypothetical protein